MPDVVKPVKIGVVHRIRHSATRSTARMDELRKQSFNEIRRHGEPVEAMTSRTLGDDGPQHVRIMFSAYVIPYEKKDAGQ